MNEIATADREQHSHDLAALEKAFAREYMVDRRGTDAVIRAGYSGANRGSAATTATRLLARPSVRAEIERLEQADLWLTRQRLNLNLERTLKKTMDVAFFDPRKLLHPDGSPKALNELDEATAAAIEGIEIVEKWEGSGDEKVFVGNVIRYKLAKRQGFLDMLMKHLGGYKEDNGQQAGAAANALVELLGQMKGSALPVVQRVNDDDVTDV